MARKKVARARVAKAQRKRMREYGANGETVRANALWSPKELPRICRQVETLVGVHGYTDTEIADFYNISKRHLYRVKIKYPELAKAMVRAEGKLAEMVERKLVEAALGFRKRGMKIMQHEGEPMIVHYEEEVSPSVAAQVAYLKAKKPDEYRERVEHTGDPKSPVRFIIDGLDVTHEPVKKG